MRLKNDERIDEVFEEDRKYFLPTVYLNTEIMSLLFTTTNNEENTITKTQFV